MVCCIWIATLGSRVIVPLGFGFLGCFGFVLDCLVGGLGLFTL